MVTCSTLEDIMKSRDLRRRLHTRRVHSPLKPTHPAPMSCGSCNASRRVLMQRAAHECGSSPLPGRQRALAPSPHGARPRCSQRVRKVPITFGANSHSLMDAKCVPSLFIFLNVAYLLKFELFNSARSVTLHILNLTISHHSEDEF